MTTATKPPTLLVTDDASGETHATTGDAFLRDNESDPATIDEAKAAIRFLSWKLNRFGRYESATIGGGAGVLFVLRYDEEGRFCPECFVDLHGNDPHGPDCAEGTRAAGLDGIDAEEYANG